MSRSREEAYDRARSEYAAGATWHDLHAFASAREETRRRLRGRLKINPTVSINNKSAVIRDIASPPVAAISRNKFPFARNFSARMSEREHGRLRREVRRASRRSISNSGCENYNCEL